jgi:mannose-6-phosphate isomerase
MTYPLRFDPIYQYRRRLENWLTAPLPGDGPIGEAWLLSDRDEYPSRVADGPLKGRTIAQLMEQSSREILGRLAPRFRRFPLLLKFLDVQKMLSVQVHPSDGKTRLIPYGDTGKTEAWVVLQSGPQSRIYAGLKSGVTALDLRAISTRTADNCLASFTPTDGQSVLIEAGTVHSIGGDIVVFEVQENSDVTFRLYDWDHIDETTGLARPLQVEQALACVDFTLGAIQPVSPIVETGPPTSREQLIDCSHFRMERVRSALPFDVGETGVPRVLVCIDGGGAIEFNGDEFSMEKGTVMLLPAALGVCRFRPESPVSMLELAVPE